MTEKGKENKMRGRSKKVRLRSRLGAASREVWRQRNRKNKRHTDALDMLATDFVCELSAQQIAATQEYVRANFHIAPTQFENPQALWHDLSRCAENLKLIRVSREKYFTAISYIAALSDLIAAHPEKDEILRKFCEELKIRPSKKLDQIAIIARTAIDYGKEKDARKLWARDAAAIRYLRAINVAPPDIISFQREHGGGLDSWAREWRKTRTNSPPKQRPEQADEHTNLESLRENPGHQSPKINDGEGYLWLFVGDAGVPERLRVHVKLPLGPVPADLSQSEFVQKLQALVSEYRAQPTGSHSAILPKQSLPQKRSRRTRLADEEHNEDEK